jgi:hypothetical protein
MYDMLRATACQCPPVSIDGLVPFARVHLDGDAAFASGGFPRLAGEEYLLRRICHPAAYFHLRLRMHQGA